MLTDAPATPPTVPLVLHGVLVVAAGSLLVVVPAFPAPVPPAALWVLALVPVSALIHPALVRVRL